MVSGYLRGAGVLAAVFLTTVMQTLDGDRLRLRQVQTALGATNHVFGGAPGGGFGRSKVLYDAA
jgi:hypothetical protein